jgi:hypothetical protein
MVRRFLVKGHPVFVNGKLATVTIHKNRPLPKKDFEWLTAYLISEGFMDKDTRFLVRVVSDWLYRKTMAETLQ